MEIGKNDLYLDPKLHAGYLDFSRAENAGTKTKEADNGSYSNIGGDVDTAGLDFTNIGDLVDLDSVSSSGATAREERIKSLKAMISDGEYNVNSYNLAGDPGLINSILG
ncbi:MAG: flagellar biosynthesis anti-sigma factor FlgM [Candidatus Caenarcaniphilales bacterium]|nr:flagellar biosynthesis anti-sigma factor FlgM [Candidatus Caenarcaniphilales bacterium]